MVTSGHMEPTFQVEGRQDLVSKLAFSGLAVRQHVGDGDGVQGEDKAHGEGERQDPLMVRGF